LSATTSNLDEVQLLRQENAALRAQIAWLKQKLFGGGKSETLDQAQLRLKLAERRKRVRPWGLGLNASGELLRC
jgi:hypothetical protein